MKYNKVPYIVALAAGLQMATGCKDKFIEAEPKGNVLETNYYKDAAQAMTGLIAVYDVVGYQSNGDITRVGAFDAASDDHVAGGGGPNDISAFQVFSNYTLSPASGPQADLWKKGYSGIYRANVLLS